MHVMLYTVRTRMGWVMGFTLNIQVDMFYWMNSMNGQVPARKSLVLLNRKVPFQVALRAAQYFEAQVEMDHWDEVIWKAYMDAFLVMAFSMDIGYEGQSAENIEVVIYRSKADGGSNLVHEGAAAYELQAVGSAKLSWNSWYRGNERIGGMDVHHRGRTSLGDKSGRSVREPDLLKLAERSRRLCELVEGRSLLESELLSMMEAHGDSMHPQELHAALQWGVLLGKLELTNGVAWGESTSRWGRLGQRVRRVVGRSLEAFKVKAQADVVQMRQLVASDGPSCRRCGSKGSQLEEAKCASCGSEKCWTCTACLNIGRSRSCALLVVGVGNPDPTVSVADRRLGSEVWSELLDRYNLAPAQRDASLRALQYLSERDQPKQLMKGEFLLWAVTGAGKTEMMFPLVAYALRAKKRVCIATPRRDVVLELKPRIEKAFAEARVATLYGGSTERWTRADITLATTHQLLRFAGAFELVVIDELDAFPYHNNPMLQHAAEQACKPGGAFVYLSATPPAKMQRAVKRGKLAQAIVPVRYHRHPLPVPERMPMQGVARAVASGRISRLVIAALQESVARGAQVFVFVARIRHIDGMVQLLRKVLPQQPVEGTSASDGERTEKVQRFRQGEIRVLVTTTILERGVTVPRSDVFIMDAHDRLFDTSSLVQMAGRAGRSKDDPKGRVMLAAPQWTSAQRGAVQQIRRMNRLAKRGGYLLESI